MKKSKQIQLKIVIFTAVKTRSILHGHVFVMLFPYHGLKSVTTYIKMGDNRTLRLHKKRHKIPTCTLNNKLYELNQNHRLITVNSISVPTDTPSLRVSQCSFAYSTVNQVKYHRPKLTNVSLRGNKHSLKTY